jgi:hypothetical protein
LGLLASDDVMSGRNLLVTENEKKEGCPAVSGTDCLAGSAPANEWYCSGTANLSTGTGEVPFRGHDEQQFFSFAKWDLKVEILCLYHMGSFCGGERCEKCAGKRRKWFWN